MKRFKDYIFKPQYHLVHILLLSSWFIWEMWGTLPEPSSIPLWGRILLISLVIIT